MVEVRAASVTEREMIETNQREGTHRLSDEAYGKTLIMMKALDAAMDSLDLAIAHKSDFTDVPTGNEYLDKIESSTAQLRKLLVTSITGTAPLGQA